MARIDQKKLQTVLIENWTQFIDPPSLIEMVFNIVMKNNFHLMHTNIPDTINKSLKIVKVIKFDVKKFVVRYSMPKNDGIVQGIITFQVLSNGTLYQKKCTGLHYTSD